MREHNIKAQILRKDANFMTLQFEYYLQKMCNGAVNDMPLNRSKRKFLITRDFFLRSDKLYAFLVLYSSRTKRLHVLFFLLK